MFSRAIQPFRAIGSRNRGMSHRSDHHGHGLPAVVKLPGNVLDALALQVKASDFLVSVNLNDLLFRHPD